MARRTLILMLVAFAAAVALPASAAADYHLMTVNEIVLSQGGNANAQYVEMLDPFDEGFPDALKPFKLVVYNASGTKLGAVDLGVDGGVIDNGTPLLVSTTAFPGPRDKTLPTGLLPAGSGQVCYTQGSTENKVDCLAYGCVAKPFLDNLDNGKAPADGQSLGRRSGDLVLATPTPKTANGPGTPAACAGSGDHTAPDAALSGKTKQKLGKNISVTVRCETETCSASATGTLAVPGAARTFKIKSKSVEIVKGDKATLKLKLSRKARRAAKAALKHGRKVKAKLKVTVEDAAGNSATKRRAIKLKR